MNWLTDKLPTHMLDHHYIYFPEPWDGSQDWRAVCGLPLQDVWLTTQDGIRIFGWYVERPDALGTLLWSHGNAGNIIHRLDDLAQYVRRGMSVFLYDYRGYGQSQGCPDEEGLYLDGLAAWSYLAEVQRIPASRIVAFGQSLGAAVAGEIARQRPVAGLILESAFPSVEAVARRLYGGLPAHLLVKARFDLAQRLKAVRVPVLVLHGDRDEIIPLGLGEQVHRAANEPRSFYCVAGAGHNDMIQASGEAYYREFLRFVREVTVKNNR